MEQYRGVMRRDGYKIMKARMVKPDKDERFCVRCGMSPKEVYSMGEGGHCCVYGSHYGNHSYTTDKELEEYGKKHEGAWLKGGE